VFVKKRIHDDHAAPDSVVDLVHVPYVAILENAPHRKALDRAANDDPLFSTAFVWMLFPVLVPVMYDEIVRTSPDTNVTPDEHHDVGAPQVKSHTFGVAAATAGALAPMKPSPKTRDRARVPSCFLIRSSSSRLSAR